MGSWSDIKIFYSIISYSMCPFIIKWGKYIVNIMDMATYPDAISNTYYGQEKHVLCYCHMYDRWWKITILTFNKINVLLTWIYSFSLNAHF